MSAEDWDLFKERDKERVLDAAERRDAFGKLFDEGRLPGFHRCHETHYQYHLLGDLLDFWPGPGTFRWRNQTRHGILLMPFIREKERDHEKDKRRQV